MEQVPKNFSEILKDQLFFNTISKFLSYKDFFSLTSTNKMYSEMGNLYLRMFLKQLNFSRELDKHPEIQNYSYILRYLFYRELLNAHITNEEHLKVFRNNKLDVNNGIQHFSVGINFSGFHLYNKDLIIVKSKDLHDISKDDPELLRLHKIENFSTNAKNFFYLNNNHEIYCIFNEENVKLASLKIMKLNIPFNVVDLKVSYNRIILICKNNQENSSSIKDLSNDHWLVSYIQNNKAPFLIFVLSLSELSNEVAFQDPIQFLRAIESQNIKNEIQSFSLSENFAYFVNESSNIFQVDLASQKKILPQTAHPYFANKPIKKVFSGLFYSFAIEKEEMKSIDTWDNAKVLQWAEEIGFSDWVKILKYENIVGSQLATANKAFLIDTLGINKTDLQNKFLTEIYNNLKTRFKKEILYGWGSNNSGQLGLPPCNNVAHPTKIVLPEINDDDEIEKIECGWKICCILTKNHHLFMSGTSEKKQAEKLAHQNEEEEKVGASKKSKKDAKKHVQAPEIKEKTRWINISSDFERLKDNRTYLIADVSIGKEYISVLGGFTGFYKENLSVEDKNEKKSKIKMAGAIIDRIKWDQTLNEKEYRIGYEDRFLGIVEIEFEEFIAKTAEIKEHRIKYFKKSGEIVWDKNLRIDKF